MVECCRNWKQQSNLTTASSAMLCPNSMHNIKDMAGLQWEAIFIGIPLGGD